MKHYRNFTCWIVTGVLFIILLNAWYFMVQYKKKNNIVTRESSSTKSVAICVVVKLSSLSELDDIQEWIEYHQLLGISNIYIYDNNSTINIKEILKRYTRVTVHTIVGTKIQRLSYDICLKSYGKLHDWLALIDVDEFVVLNTKKILIDYLTDFNSYGALVLFEKFYGSSNHSTRPIGGVLQNYNECKSTDYMKSIINTKAVYANDIHTPLQFVNGYYFVNSERKHSCDSNKIRSKCLMTFQDIWINHYSVKSVEEFEIKKIKGGGNGKFRQDSFYNWTNEYVYDCGTIHTRGSINHHYTNVHVSNKLLADIPPRFCHLHDYSKSSTTEFIWKYVSNNKTIFEVGSNILNHLDHRVCANFYNYGKLKNYYYMKDRYFGRQMRMYDSKICLNHFEFIGVVDSSPRSIISALNRYTNSNLNVIDVVIVGSDFRLYPVLLLLFEGYLNYVLLVGWRNDYYHILLEYMTVIDCLDEVIILQKKDSINYQTLIKLIPSYNHNVSDFKWMTRINY